MGGAAKADNEYRTAGDGFVEWLNRVGHVLTDLDGTSKTSGGKRLMHQGVRIYAGSAAGKLNAYGSPTYRKNRVFLKTEEVIRLAVFCGRDPSEAIAGALKNGFEQFVKSVIFPPGNGKISFDEVLALACNDEEALERGTDFLVSVFHEAVVETNRLFGLQSAPAAYAKEDLFCLDTCAEAIHLPIPDLSRVLASSKELLGYSEGGFHAPWTVFGDTSVDSRLGGVVRDLRRRARKGAHFPFVHYHDLQGAFDIPWQPGFDEDIRRSDPRNLVALRLGCVFLVNGMPVAFPSGEGRYSLVTTVDRDNVPVSGIVDHQAAMAAHIGRYVPAKDSEGELRPYGLLVADREDLRVSERRAYVCTCSIRYLFLVSLPGKPGLSVPCVPAAAVANALPAAEAALLAQVGGHVSPGAVRRGATLVAPFMPTVTFLFAKALAIREDRSSSEASRPVVSVSVLPASKGGSR